MRKSSSSKTHSKKRMHVCTVYIASSDSEEYSTDSDKQINKSRKSSTFVKAEDKPEASYRSGSHYSRSRSTIQEQTKVNRHQKSSYVKRTRETEIPSQSKNSYIYVVSNDGVEEIDKPHNKSSHKSQKSCMGPWPQPKYPFGSPNRAAQLGFPSKTQLYTSMMDSKYEEKPSREAENRSSISHKSVSQKSVSQRSISMETRSKVSLGPWPQPKYPFGSPNRAAQLGFPSKSQLYSSMMESSPKKTSQISEKRSRTVANKAPAKQQKPKDTKRKSATRSSLLPPQDRTTQYLNSPEQKRLSKRISKITNEPLDEETDDLFGSNAMAPPIHQKPKDIDSSDFSEEEEEIEEDSHEEIEEDSFEEEIFEEVKPKKSEKPRRREIEKQKEEEFEEESFSDDSNPLERLYNIKSLLDNYRSPEKTEEDIEQIVSEYSEQPMRKTPKKNTPKKARKQQKAKQTKPEKTTSKKAKSTKSAKSASKKAAKKEDTGKESKLRKAVKNILDSYSFTEEEEKPKPKVQKKNVRKQQKVQEEESEKEIYKRNIDFEEEEEGFQQNEEIVDNEPIVFKEEPAQDDELQIEKEEITSEEPQSSNTLDDENSDFNIPPPTPQGKSSSRITAKRSLLDDDSDSDLLPVYVSPKADEIPVQSIPPMLDSYESSSDDIDPNKILKEIDNERSDDDDKIATTPGNISSIALVGLDKFIIKDEEEEEEEYLERNQQEMNSSSDFENNSDNFIEEEDLEDEEFTRALNQKLQGNLNDEEEAQSDSLSEKSEEKFGEDDEEFNSEPESFSPIRQQAVAVVNSISDDDDDLPKIETDSDDDSISSKSEGISEKIKNILADSSDTDSESEGKKEDAILEFQKEEEEKHEEEIKEEPVLRKETSSSSSSSSSSDDEKEETREINIEPVEEKKEEVIPEPVPKAEEKPEVIPEDPKVEEDSFEADLFDKEDAGKIDLDDDEEEDNTSIDSVLKEQDKDLTKGLEDIMHNIGIDDSEEDDDI